jgi:hypothetical protein
VAALAFFPEDAGSGAVSGVAFKPMSRGFLPRLRALAANVANASGCWPWPSSDAPVFAFVMEPSLGATQGMNASTRPQFLGIAGTPLDQNRK